MLQTSIITITLFLHKYLFLLYHSDFLNIIFSLFLLTFLMIQGYAEINDEKIFCEALKDVYGKSRFSLHPVRSTDGVLIKNTELILAKWADYLQNLLSKVHTTDPGFLDDLPTMPTIQKLDNPPSFGEVEKAIRTIKDNKTAGPDNISVRSFSMVRVLYTEG